MSHYHWSIDEGHGGILRGSYTTPERKGKQHTFDDGFTIFEGVINRKIGAKLKSMLDEANIDYTSINDAIGTDTPLSARVYKIDDLFHVERQENKRVSILISIHSNKLTPPDEITGKGQNVARNFTIWTSKGQTQSDKLVEFFERGYKNNVPEFKFAKDTSDGDSDFEADFYILRKSDGPAILVENLFFDNRKCAEFLSSDEGQNRIAKSIFDGIISCENIKPV